MNDRIRITIMKTKKSFDHLRLFLIPVSIFILILSCEKDEENPDYVGKWAMTATISVDNRIMGYKDILTFSTNTFSEIQQLKDPDTNEWIAFLGIKGSISVDGYIISYTITEIGVSSSN